MSEEKNRVIEQPRIFPDNWCKLDDDINEENIPKKYEYSQNKDIYKTDDMSTGIVLKPTAEIRTIDQFKEELIQFKSAKVLQTFLSLCSYCNEKNNFEFSINEKKK